MEKSMFLKLAQWLWTCYMQVVISKYLIDQMKQSKYEVEFIQAVVELALLVQKCHVIVYLEIQVRVIHMLNNKINDFADSKYCKSNGKYE